MPPMMSSYARNNRLLNYRGSALDYYYHPEHYGLSDPSVVDKDKAVKRRVVDPQLKSFYTARI